MTKEKKKERDLSKEIKKHGFLKIKGPFQSIKKKEKDGNGSRIGKGI